MLFAQNTHGRAGDAASGANSEAEDERSLHVKGRFFE